MNREVADLALMENDQFELEEEIKFLDILQKNFLYPAFNRNCSAELTYFFHFYILYISS